MAARTLYPTWDAGPTNWSAPAWSLADDDAKDEAKPINGDTVIFSGSSGAIALDENSANLASLTMTGYMSTLAMGTNDIDCAGGVVLDGTLTASAGAAIACGGGLTLANGMTLAVEIAWTFDAASGPYSLIANSVTMGAITVNDSGGSLSLVMQDALTCAAFVLTSGTFITNSNDWTPNSISGAAGEIQFGGSTVVASGDITLDNITATIGAGSITAANLDIGTSGSLTASDDFTTNADVTVDGGTLNLGNNTWTQTTDDTFTHTSGTVTCTTNYSATIDADGNTISSITASNWINIVSGINGGGNTKLAFSGQYRLYRGIGGISEVDFNNEVGEVAGGLATATFTGLGHAANTRYTYVLRPVRTLEDTGLLITPDMSCTVEFETDGSVEWIGDRPGSIEGLSAEVISGGEIRLRWNFYTPYGDDAPADFGIYYSTDPAITPGSPQDTEAYTADGSYYKDLALSGGVAYHFAITARTSAPVESHISEIIGPFLADDTAPGAPTLIVTASF